MHGPLRLRHGSYHLYLPDVLISCPDERDPFGKHLSAFVCLGSLTLNIQSVPAKTKLRFYQKLRRFFEDEHNSLFKETLPIVQPSIPSTGEIVMITSYLPITDMHTT